MSTLLRWLITGIKVLVQILVITWTTLAVYFSNLPWPALRLALAVAFAAFATWAFWLGIQGGDIPLGASVSLFMVPILTVVAVFILRDINRRGNEA